MRGGDERTGELFSYVDLEDRVRRGHPLRAIRLIVNEALAALEGEFAALYSPIGRPSIAPEKLLRAMLLQAFYSIRSERLLMERLEYDLLFRWFVGIGIDDAAWDHSVSSKNRDRLLEGDIAAKFLGAILIQPKVKRLLSTDHFSVDGTLIEAWASMKSIKPKDGSGTPPAGSGGRNAETDFHGEKRTNQTHASTTDPEARLYRKGKGKETKLCFMGHGLMENRHGLLVDACLWGRDEADVRARHKKTWNQPIHRIRGRIENIFGTWKRSYGLRRMRWRGLAKAGVQTRLTAIAYNMKRSLKIIAAAG